MKHINFRCDFVLVPPSTSTTTFAPTTLTPITPVLPVCSTSNVWFYIAIPSLVLNGVFVIGFIAIMACWKLKKITFNCFNLNVDNVNANFLGGRSETVINNEAFESFSSSSYEIEN